MLITARTPSVSRSRRVVATPVGAGGGVSLGGDGVHRLALEGAFQRGLEVAGVRPVVRLVPDPQHLRGLVFQVARDAQRLVLVGRVLPAQFLWPPPAADVDAQFADYLDQEPQA